MMETSSTVTGTAVGAATTPVIQEYESFDDMELDERLLRGVYAYGFDKPSPIQKMAIVPMTKGRDILAQAQSGTGKTGAFLIGGISRIDTSKNEIQMVVISPTRELADQTASVARNIGGFIGLRVHVATGGSPVGVDLEMVHQPRGIATPRVPHLLVVTPGRFYDLLDRKAVSTPTIRVLVLDEADQLLELRFRAQIHLILAVGWRETTMVGLFSATMIPELADVAKTLLNNHIEILIEPEKVTLEGIKQYYVEVDRDDHKLDTLCDIYEHMNVQQVTIFVNTRMKAEMLADQMRRRGFDLDCIHGEMDTNERKSRMNDFRSGKCRVLISTDLLARGIDVQQVSLVINFELPVQRENYIHRIGRSGRYGKKGASINLVTVREMSAQSEIEKYYGAKINALPLDLKSLV